AASRCALSHTCRNFVARSALNCRLARTNRRTFVKFAPKQSSRVAAQVNDPKTYRLCAENISYKCNVPDANRRNKPDVTKREILMENVRRYRALASLCRQQAAYRPLQSCQLLGQAEY